MLHVERCTQDGSRHALRRFVGGGNRVQVFDGLVRGAGIGRIIAFGPPAAALRLGGEEPCPRGPARRLGHRDHGAAVPHPGPQTIQEPVPDRAAVVAARKDDHVVVVQPRATQARRTHRRRALPVAPLEDVTGPAHGIALTRGVVDEHHPGLAQPSHPPASQPTCPRARRRHRSPRPRPGAEPRCPPGAAAGPARSRPRVRSPYRSRTGGRPA